MNDKMWRWSKNPAFDIEPLPGSNIVQAIATALRLSNLNSRVIRMKFNDITIVVAPDSDSKLLLRDFHRAIQGSHHENVGPHPAPVLTSEEIAHDDAILAENAHRRAAAQADYNAKKRIKRERVTTIVADIAFESCDLDGWVKYCEANNDPYGAAVIEYSELWARLMQIKIRNGQTLENMAEVCSQEADIDGITGFMYNCAINILGTFWVHGPELLRYQQERRTNLLEGMPPQ
ncbi:MAG: hypothetical protein NUV91_02760 [Candidatus Omnitrophica bacterium]|nr:hypothetical protein [Candidatus Omnitrophota bacterium]